MGSNALDSVKALLKAIQDNEKKILMEILDKDIELEIPVTTEHDKVREILEYTGKHKGINKVLQAIELREKVIETKNVKAYDFTSQNNRVFFTTLVNGICRKNGELFETESLNVIDLTDESKVKKWKIYFDSKTVIEAFKKD